MDSFIDKHFLLISSFVGLLLCGLLYYRIRKIIAGKTDYKRIKFLLFNCVLLLIFYPLILYVIELFGGYETYLFLGSKDFSNIFNLISQFIQILLSLYIFIIALTKFFDNDLAILLNKIIRIIPTKIIIIKIITIIVSLGNIFFIIFYNIVE